MTPLLLLQLPLFGCESGVSLAPMHCPYRHHFRHGSFVSGPHQGPRILQRGLGVRERIHQVTDATCPSIMGVKTRMPQTQPQWGPHSEGSFQHCWSNKGLEILPNRVLVEWSGLEETGSPGLLGVRTNGDLCVPDVKLGAQIGFLFSILKNCVLGFLFL